MTAVRAWDALPSPVRAALESGATVVTPNKRLARRLAALYDGAQRERGHAVWAAPLVVPWSGWLERLWLDVLATEAPTPPPRVVTSAQGAYQWRRIVAAEGLPLIDANGAALLAAEAWSTVHAWGAGGPSWRAWGRPEGDCASFVRWAEEYTAMLVAAAAVDLEQLPDELARRAATIPDWHGASVLLAGMIEVTPQQQRLMGALRDAGMTIAQSATVRGAVGTTGNCAGTTARDEAIRALQWARARATANPGATIAIAFEDLAMRREEIRALADDILCPALQWPGQETTPRPYNLSLGVAASEVPMLAAALDLIRFAHAPLPMARAAALLRSPYLSQVEGDTLRRAQLEADWLRDGRHEISLDEAIVALGEVDRDLALRWRSAHAAHRRPGSATPREWIESWRSWLAAAGWPGGRALSSSEWQAQRAWDDVLAQFATLAALSRRLAAHDAVAALIALAKDRVFQPESPRASVEIMGALEAAGLPLDALWVAGLAAEVWPPAPRPNPFLPVQWQRERNAPRASASRELAYAQALTEQWAHGAAEVVFSYATGVDDHARSVSALVPRAPPVADTGAPAPSTATAQFESAPPFEPVRDDRAPVLDLGTLVRGGAALIEAQSDCPFRAYARYRLAVDAWPAPAEGLSARERGIVVHAAFAAFWTGVRDHATLVALDAEALGRRVDSAAVAAIAALSAARWRRIAPVVRTGEAVRLAALVRAWLDGFERPRPPFRVAAMEEKRRIALGGLELDLRVDRIDALSGGGSAVIDYKTGQATAPRKWFESRPEAPQLGLYVLAQHAFAPDEPVRAAAYAQLKPGELKLEGLAADANAWPALAVAGALDDVELRDWRAVEAMWKRLLDALATEFRDGHATVTPRDTRKTCKHCGLQPLCRIGALVDEGFEDDGDG